MEPGAALVHGLAPFLARVGVINVAGAGLHMQAAALDDGGADGDGGVGIKVPAEPES